jgi:hypothetical protein
LIGNKVTLAGDGRILPESSTAAALPARRDRPSEAAGSQKQGLGYGDLMSSQREFSS